MFMNQFSNSKFIAPLSSVLILIFVAKAISLVLLYLLPAVGVEHRLKNDFQPPFQIVDFKNMFKPDKANKSKAKKIPLSKDIKSLTNMLLKGLYGNSKEGFAIVSLKSSPNKTSIVSLGEEFYGYKLSKIASKSVVFTKNKKEYILKLEGTKNSQKNKSVYQNSEDDIVRQESISRDDIKYYSKNPKEIWKNISIIEYKKDGKVKGFKVVRIKRDSLFANIGLKKGDIIIKANNKELKSFRDALAIYSKIKTLDTISLVVLRGGEEKEIIYEIN